MIIAVEILFSLYLLMLALSDIRKKTLDVRAVLAGVLCAPLFLLCGCGWGIKEQLIGLIPGLIFYVIGRLSRWQIGFGDVLLILVTGLNVGIINVLRITGGAFAAIMPVAFVLLVLGRLNKKSTLPFVPFLFAGNLLRLFF